MTNIILKLPIKNLLIYYIISIMYMYICVILLCGFYIYIYM